MCGSIILFSSHSTRMNYISTDNHMFWSTEVATGSNREKKTMMFINKRILVNSRTSHTEEVPEKFLNVGELRMWETFSGRKLCNFALDDSYKSYWSYLNEYQSNSRAPKC